jgi:PTS system nitrogen regulatory IIA component
MPLNDILKPGAVFTGLRAVSKKQLLQALSEKAAALTGLPEREVFDTLQQRERLGSTGVGNGIAIPHGKLKGAAGLTGLFARLDQSIDFEAIDNQKVDLVFLLIAPETAGADHLKALSKVARAMRNQDTIDRVRNAADALAVYDILCPKEASFAA